jgi:uncharacterized ion transporter superfamily protein YfcC
MTRKLKVPHTLVLLYGMILVAYPPTLVLPASQFETLLNDHGHEVVVPGTYAVPPEIGPLPLMGILGICGIPYGRWFRFIWPLMLQLLVLGSITMVVAVLVGYR